MESVSEEMRGKQYLSKDTGFTGFVLSDFVNGVFSAAFAFAVSTTGLRNVDCVLVSLRERKGTGMGTHDLCEMRSTMRARDDG